MDKFQISYTHNDWNKKSDVEIWNAIKSDDMEAFSFIYNKYIKMMYNYGMKIHYDEYLIPEAIQELFVETWHRRKNDSNVQNIKIYLLKSLRYKLYRAIGKKKQFNLVSLENITEKVSLIAPHEDELIDLEVGNDRRLKIASKINQLPDRQREAIILYFYENYSYEEIASIMSINLRSVYTLLWKAVSNLKKLITKFDHDLFFFL